MPGKKDFVPIQKEDRTREHIQKRLIRGNLTELYDPKYDHFKVQNENIKIGFSKFAQLRPRNSVLAGVSVIDTVCVCIYYENVHLIHSINLLTEVAETDIFLERLYENLLN